MGKMLSREDYRRIKNYSKEEMTKWLDYHESMLYNLLRKEFEKAYKDELDSSISNFLIAVWYTLHFNEEVHLQPEELGSFMKDLYVSVDFFRNGEYTPDDYKKELEEDGIQFEKFDYDKLYREKDGKYKKINEDTKKFIEEWMANLKQPTINVGDLQMIIDRLEVE